MDEEKRYTAWQGIRDHWWLGTVLPAMALTTLMGTEKFWEGPGKRMWEAAWRGETAPGPAVPAPVVREKVAEETVLLIVTPEGRIRHVRGVRGCIHQDRERLEQEVKATLEEARRVSREVGCE
jgi:hypothetical protein